MPQHSARLRCASHPEKAVIDIILTTFNRVSHLKRTVDSFLACTDRKLISRLLVANDGSTDGTQGYLESLAAQHDFVRILPNPHKRCGLIPRFNQAFIESNTEIVCEIQDDIQFYHGWLEQQLAALEKYKGADFISGYDGAEHKTFAVQDGYKIKYSNGFVQLLATRSTWSRWFPMAPKHPFPTPCVRNGKSIGSTIDCSIYGRKNNRNGAVTYLVIPGLIHTAHRFNSSWRPSLDQNHRFNRQKAGGLKIGELRDYWRARAAKQGEIAVGFAGRPKEIQEAILQEKIAFIRQWIHPDLLTIDYGCGVGLFSRLFSPDLYLGMDITPEFLVIARQNNPQHRYEQIEPGTIPAAPIEQFLTVNVLQHNDDITVAEIFRKLGEKYPEGGLRIVLYENSHDAKDSPHMRFRKPEEYAQFVAEHFAIHKMESASHVVHGEEHSITVLQC